MKRIYLVFGTLLIILFANSCGSTKQEYDNCPIWIDEPIKLTPTQLSSISTKGGYALTFNPLFLPFAIKWNHDRGFYVEYSNNERVLTPIGSVGLEYSVSSGTKINGVNVKKSDFLVSIVDRNKREKQIFKIEGYSRLKVVLSGRTEIDAQSGVVEIDATNAIINEINFYDNTKAILLNKTNKTVTYKIEVGNNYSTSTISYKCEIPSKTYVKIPIDELNSLISANVFIRISNDKANNDTYSELKKKITYGDFCAIKENKKNELELIKTMQKK